MRSCPTLCLFSSRRRHTRLQGDWSSDVCSSDLRAARLPPRRAPPALGGKHPEVAVAGAAKVAAQEGAARHRCPRAPMRQALPVPHSCPRASAIQMLADAPIQPGQRLLQPRPIRCRRRREHRDMAYSCAATAGYRRRLTTTIRRVIRASCRYHRPSPGRTALSGPDGPITNLSTKPADTLSWHLGACQLRPAENLGKAGHQSRPQGCGSAHAVIESSTAAYRPLSPLRPPPSLKLHTSNAARPPTPWPA